MRWPPRDPAQRLFGRRVLTVSLLQGLSTFFVLAVVYSVALYRGQGELDARALTFTALIITNLGLILTNRSWSAPVSAMLRVPNASVDTSKPAIRGQAKTGHRSGRSRPDVL